ncbi:MAG: cyclomaltodextrinase N-terminal domain-containing protein [Gemmatimonadetes bacterium]|nr:cyclomaltodextrinase N-terminal domain-containing protein [Gemmatimonadota bacterium]MBI3567953.1 cyclomaltodextrinase N-terminal domain-containing protein [Gemmatimonadota bacterium]
MSRTIVRALAATSMLAAATGAPFARVAGAQAPVVDKVDPPNWWTGSTINPVRVLIRGKNLGGASARCAQVKCTDLKVNAAGTYAFVDVTVPSTQKPGKFPFSLKTAAGTATVPFEITAPLPGAGRFQGFGNNDVVYLIMPDRFANGDPSNDDPPESRGLWDRTKKRYYHGGDIAGVRQKLPYLKALGVTTIWLNPIYDNNNALNTKETYDGEAITDYHGYGATDFYKVEEHFGTLDDFRKLTDEAHAQGMKIVLDMVANHTGPFHPWVKDSPTPTWYHGTAEHHPDNDWQTWNLADPHGTPDTRRSALDGWFINILPDLNQDDPEVARYITQNTLWWVEMSGLDGIRQDTWPYVPRTFWASWMTAIRKEFPKLKVLGEVSDGDPSMVSFFEGGRKQDGIDDKVDMLFDYPLFYPLRRAFGEGKPLREVAQMLGRDHLYRDAASSLVTFVDLHDVSRFMNDKGATTAGLELAYTFLLTARGTPMLYYGDEIGLPGGGDPDNRRDFPGGWKEDPRNAFEAAGRTPDEQAVFAHVQKLLQLRAANADLRGADTKNLLVTNQQFVYRRGRFIVALNNDTLPANVRIPIGDIGADLLGICPKARIDANAPLVTMPKRSGCIFLITSEKTPGPSLGVTGTVRHHPDFASKFVAPRNVDVWLPPGYDKNSAARYPVLYMMDGQNVFDPSLSFGGVDWAADEWMTTLIAQNKVRPAIVVGVWNTAKRFEEYMPQKPVANDTLISTGIGGAPIAGRAISDAYLKFMVTELKPFIDKTYRTKAGRADTFIMGSSMGGLIAAYAITEYPDVFGGAACVSTHWPIGDGVMVEYLRRNAPDPKTHKFYMDHGTETLDANYAPWQAKVDAVMREKGYVDGKNYLTREFKGADHSERAWRARLDVPLTFLLAP